jgi:hypothetical protein
MNGLDLDAIRARANAATPGTWIVYDAGEEDFPSWWVWRKDKLPYYGGILAPASEHADEPGGIGLVATDDVDHTEQEHLDAEFIAHARADVPALITEVRRLKDELKRIRALCDAQGEDSYVMVHALRAILGEQP